jgi:hypothetical protein
MMHPKRQALTLPIERRNEALPSLLLLEKQGEEEGTSSLPVEM